jgi:hypothetical protein
VIIYSQKEGETLRGKGKRTMKTTITYTYWMELRTGMIYKYEFGTKPYKAETDWRQVSGWDFDRQFTR